MLSHPALQKLYYLALYLTALVIPFPFIFAPIAIIVLATTWIINFNTQRVVNAFKERKALWVWVLFYALHALSYFYTINRGDSLNDLESKLSFIILPIIVGTGLNIDKKIIENIFTAFISGLFVVAVYLLTKATILWINTADTGVFFYHNLIYGFGANAVYFALYSFLGLTLLLLYSWEHTFLSRKIILYTFFSTLIVFFILLSSKSMILLFCLLVVPFYIKKILTSRKLIGIVYTIAFISITGIVFFTKNPIQKRFYEVSQNTDKTEWLPEYSNGQKQHFNNLTLRLFLWNTAIHNVVEHNLWLKGCGNGGVTELQKKKITEYGTKSELLKADPPLWHYNIHNMYLQTLMMLGIPGTLVFLVILFMPFFFLKYVQNKINFVYFNVSMITFMIQESAFQTQAGIIFFTFFSIVFYNYAYSERKIKYAI